MAKKPFKGVIKLDVRDSTPDWTPYTPTKAPEGAPNVLLVLFDDTGQAAWSPSFIARRYRSWQRSDQSRAIAAAIWRSTST
jgi:hypothetical protein